MPKTQIDLMPNEKMVLYSNPHWWFFWKEVTGALVLLIALILLVIVEASWFDTTLSFLIPIAIVVLLVMTAYQFVQWKTTKFAITDQRVAYQSGIIKRQGVSIPLNRINNVNFTQTVIARALNNGVVTIESAGQTGDSVFENIPDPEKVRMLIFQQVEHDEQRDSDRDAASLAKAMGAHMAPPTTAPAGAGSATERLKQLDDLKAQGLVSPEEYAQKRAKILEEL
jgi:uncharacterized membrane protein YdbT with pleckstrin-like domain